MANKWQLKHGTLERQVVARIMSLVIKKGKESKHSTERCLKVKQDQQFNLDGGRWLEEISADKLIDNYGYTYSYSVLTLDQLCQIADNI